MYTGKFIPSPGIGAPNKISFDGTKNGEAATIELTVADDAKNFASLWGWDITTLSQYGSLDTWDTGNNVYKQEGQTDFADFYKIYGKDVIGDRTSTTAGKLYILNNIDLFGQVDTIIPNITFKDFFKVPQYPINGWITPCQFQGYGKFVTLDWSYNLVLKNRLLPYMDQRFLPITDLKEFQIFNENDEIAGAVSAFASNHNLASATQPPYFGYTVGVRVYNTTDGIESGIWDQGPWVGKEFNITYDKDTWDKANRVDDPSSLYGSYRARNSMAYQFRNYTSDDQFKRYFTDESHFIAPPVGLVLE